MSFDQRSIEPSPAVLEDDIQNQYTRCLILLAKRHLYERSAHCHDPNDWGHAFYRALFKKEKESPESIDYGGFWKWLAETSLEKTRQIGRASCRERV